MAFSPRYIAVHAVGIAVEELPYASVADAPAGEVGSSVGGVIAEVLVALAVVPAHNACIADDVIRPQHRLLALLFFLGRHEGGDAALVGVTANHVIRDAHGHPHGASQLLLSGRLQRRHDRVVDEGAHHLHDPRLIGVTNRKRLALRAISVLLHQRCHHIDGLAGCLRALQSDVDERAVVDDASRIDHLLASAKGRLANGHLPFVDVADDVVSLLGLGYLA